MFSHICLGTNNLAESIAFYDQVMPVLGICREDTGDTCAGYGNKDDIGSGINCLFIGKTFNGEPATHGNGVNIALLAKTREQVVKFHALALENGGAGNRRHAKAWTMMDLPRLGGFWERLR